MVMMLKLGEKTYTTDRITAGLSREALKIQRDALEIAKEAGEIKTGSATAADADALIQKLSEINNRKSVLLCRAYGNKFSVDEMENELTNEEINAAVNKIISGVTGVVRKN